MKQRKLSRREFIVKTGATMSIATAEGIEVTIEHHNNPKAPFRISADFDEALAVVLDLRIAYDSGNIHIAGEDSLQGYKNNQEQITHVHFKDFSPDGRLCIPGQGIIDFQNLIKAMKAANYNGYINLEVPMKQSSGYEAYEIAMEILGPLIA